MARNETSAFPLNPLVRPRFHAGQLLTAESLSTLTDWANRRFALGRWGRGWGVVHGLAVTRGTGAPLELEILPGYAIDAIGRDILVSTPQTIKLAYDDLRTGSSAVDQPNQQAKPQRISVDVMVEYAAKDAAPRPVAYQTDCNKSRDCQFTRVDEGFSVVFRRTGSNDIDGSGTSDLSNHFHATLNIARDYANTFGDASVVSSEELRNFFDQHLAREDLSSFPYINREIDSWSDIPQIARADILKVIFWIILDRRLKILAAPPNAGNENARVRLATVHLSLPADVTDFSNASIESIDSSPPSRQVLNDHALSSQGGQLNIASVLWQPVNLADSRLRECGIRIRRFREIDPDRLTDVRDLIAVFEANPFAADWMRPSAYYAADEGGVDRIVGFDVPGSSALNDVSITRRHSQPAAPSATVELVYDIENTGRTDLEIDVADTLFGNAPDTVASGITLRKGSSSSVVKLYQVLNDPADGDIVARDDGNLDITSTITALARELGSTRDPVKASSHGTLTVLMPVAMSVEPTVQILRGNGGDADGGYVDYAVDIRNTGAQPLSVDLQLSGLPPDGRHTFPTEQLEPGGRITMTHRAAAPRPGELALRYRVNAQAVSRDSRMVGFESEYTLPLERPSPPTLRELLCMIWFFLFPWARR